MIYTLFLQNKKNGLANFAFWQTNKKKLKYNPQNETFTVITHYCTAAWRQHRCMISE